jgi:MFS family permease
MLTSATSSLPTPAKSNPTASIATANGVMTRAAWLALGSAFFGWMFDAMDLQIFTVIMIPSVRELTGFTDGRVQQIGALIIAGKLLCWGLGGVLFGVLADRLGRTRIMMVTILIYSVFTALSGLAQTWTQLLALQMIAGLGIGGEWAAGAALVVETWPARHRPKAVQVMQLAFVAGLVLASVLAITLAGAGWRWILAAGAFPAVFGLAIRVITPESEAWRETKAASLRGEGPKLGSLKEIFSGPLRRRTVVGSLIAAAMMIGSWGGSTLFPLLVQTLSPATSPAVITRQTGVAFMAMNVGAVLGYGSILLAVWLWPRISRRWIYAFFAAGSLVATSILYTRVDNPQSLLIALAVFGFFAIGGFGVVALYLTELFPVHVRATGQGFAWNIARLFTAAGPLLVAVALPTFGLSNVGASVGLVFALGLLVVGFGPETGREGA